MSGLVTDAGHRRVLHVLPHPGGGGERYVDLLSRLDGYEAERRYLTASGRSRAAEMLASATGALRAQAAARSSDLLHVHGEVAAGACAPTLALRPSVVTLHGLHLLRRSSGAAAIAARANLRLTVRAATRTICVSHAEY